MANISSASGAIDVPGIVSGLMGIERQPITKLTKQASSVQSKISTIGILKNQVDTVKSSADSIKTALTGNDNTVISKAVSDFVSNYNTAYSGVRNATMYKTNSLLEGDSTLRAAQNTLRGIYSNNISSGSISTLNDVGISIGTDGTMKLDSVKLNSKLSASQGDVVTVLDDIMGKYSNSIKGITEAGGTISNRIDSFNTTIKGINNKIDSLETKMVGLEKRYKYQYSQLNMILGKMSGTSSYLASQLSTK